PTPGSTERAFTDAQLATMPIDATDLTLLASLVPGVVSISGTDSSANAFSVAGLGTEANALTLDGLLFGSSNLPQEGLRQTRVITSTYDVSRGQFSGGLIASTTRSGSNVVQGSSQYQLQDEDLALAEDTSAFSQGYTQNTLSGGIGGPIVRDRLFIFGSAQGRLRDDPQQTLFTANANDFSRLGVSPDSVARFNAILNALGAKPRSLVGSDFRSSNNFTGLARMDWVVSNSHTMTFRGDIRGNLQDPARVGSLGLPQTGGQLTGNGGGFMTMVTSRFGATIINQLSGYLQGSRSDGNPFTLIPAGRVQVASLLPDSSIGVTNLVFGGNAGLPTRSRSKSFELTNELSWLPGSGGHRIKIGADWVDEQTHNVLGNNALGTYTFLSLSDLENGIASSYRRTDSITERASQNYRWNAYAGDVWVVKRPLQVTYGVRIEGSWFGDAPAYNPQVDSIFGFRTDKLPHEVHVSPRAGFTWTFGSASIPGFGGGGGGGGGGGNRGGFGGGGGFGRFSAPTLVIRGGFGEFRSTPPNSVVNLARAATGLPGSAGEVSCSGTDVPTPAWGQYWADSSTIPNQCIQNGPPVPGSVPLRSVTLIEPGFEAPRAWRGSLSIEKRLTQILRLSVEGSFARGVAQYGFRDLNLRDTAQFSLANEANRPVYVAPSDIAVQGGTPLFFASRLNQNYGTVLEAQSNLHTQSEQLTFSLGGIVGRGIQLNLSYTWQRARAQSTGERGGATGGDPNVAEWATSDFERRNSFLTTVTYPLSQSLELTSIARVTSGSPFTPLVGGDINGDGLRNDRAFVFAPGNQNTVAAGMQALLAQASPSIRDCLLSQMGTIAARSSCTSPWQYSIDFQMNWRPTFLGLNRRLTISVLTSNFLRGLDELLHGSGNTKGWGLVTRPDGTLLYVTGFDSTAHTFQYTVNERFGATYGSATAFRPPFQIGIQMRMAIGPDRARQALDALRAGNTRGAAEAAAGGFGGQGAFQRPVVTTADVIARLQAAMPNPPAQILALKDSLHLDSAQLTLLQPLSDSITLHNHVRLDSITKLLGTGRTPNFQTALPLMTPIFLAGRNEINATLTTVRAILTPEQWAKVGDDIKDPQTAARRIMFGAPPGQGGGDRGRRPNP
ncbi:MAG TPA: hypothetical protein VGI92_12925, partial [Gemmatimonadales bacterium]